MRKIMLLIFLAASLVLTACQSSYVTEVAKPDTSSTVSSDSGYPIYDSDEDYGYPVSSYESIYTPGPDFSINTPLTTSDTVVTGTGPAGVPIILIDASEMGELLGSTVIGEDGTFEFELSENLTEKHQIGIQLGDLTGTDLNANDLSIIAITLFAH